MKKKNYLITTASIMVLLISSSAAMAAITVTTAQWNQNTERLTVRATEGSGNATLTFSYDGQVYNMIKSRWGSSYRGYVNNICFSDSVTVSSTSGASVTATVSTRNGDGSGFECSNGCNPVAEVCDDNVDNDCDGAVDCDDSQCNGTGGCISAIPQHLTINSYDGPSTCIACHQSEAQDMLNSLHMQWEGPTPDLINTNGEDLGKANKGINTFCTYAMSSAGACFSCHVRADGNAPHKPDVNDVDCLMCHQDLYQRTFVQDPNNTITVTNVNGEIKTYLFGKTDAEGNYTSEPAYSKMPAGITMVELARTVHKPTRTSCLRCHATAGGGDWTKRGDIGLSTKNPTVNEDVHMSSDAGGANMVCSDCHTTDAANPHKVGGRGIDLRQTEAPAPECQDCHGTNPHGSNYSPTNRTRNPSSAYIRDRHGNEGVGCMTCHIDKYGKGGATEMSRDWLSPHWNPAFCSGQGGFVGHEIKQSNVDPEYRLFDGTSYVYNIGDTIEDADGDGYVDMARANGTLFDGVTKIVPIKNHLTVMPVHDETQQIIPPTIMWMFMTGDFDEAVQHGKQEFGYTGSYTMQHAEAEMLIAHGVAPKDEAKQCSDCHDFSGETPPGYGPLDFDALGYHVWPAKVKNCTLCHDSESADWQNMHEMHAEEMGKNCKGCHTTEPTGWVEPPTANGLCNNCHRGRSYTDAKDLHEEHAESEHGSMNTTCTDCHVFGDGE